MPKDMGGWMDRWVDVRHGRGDSHGRARKVLTDGQNNTQDMLIHKPRIAFKSLFSNLWGSFPKPEFFWQLFFSSDQLHPKEIKHTKKKKKDERERRDRGRKAEGVYFFLSSFGKTRQSGWMRKPRFWLCVLNWCFLPKYISPPLAPDSPPQQPQERTLAVRNSLHALLNRGTEMTRSFLTYVLPPWLEM